MGWLGEGVSSLFVRFLLAEELTPRGQGPGELSTRVYYHSGTELVKGSVRSGNREPARVGEYPYVGTEVVWTPGGASPAPTNGEEGLSCRCGVGGAGSKPAPFQNRKGAAPKSLCRHAFRGHGAQRAARHTAPSGNEKGRSRGAPLVGDDFERLNASGAAIRRVELAGRRAFV
jgi:hypothetical protein